MSAPTGEAPLFSVIVPLHNKAAWVARAVASVLGQGGPSRELIIVDDGSTDSPAAALAAFGGQFDLVAQVNAGPSSARNVGIAHARGRWLAFLDADDMLLPGALEHHYAALAGRRPAEVSIASYQEHALDGVVRHVDVASRLRVGDSMCDPVNLSGFRMDCVRGAHIGGFCFAREVLSRAGGFDARLRCWEIVDFVVRTLLVARGVTVSGQTLLRVFETPHSQFARMSRDAAYLAQLASNLLDYLPEVPEPEREAYCRQAAGFLYQLWDIGATKPFRALAGRAKQLDGWRDGGRAGLSRAALPLPVLDALWNIRRVRDRLVGAVKRSSAVSLRL